AGVPASNFPFASCMTARAIVIKQERRSAPDYGRSTANHSSSDRLHSMKHFISVSALLVLIASPAVMQTSTVAQADQHRAMLNTYCVTCHNTRLKTGGLALDGERLDRLGVQSAGDDAQVWEKALRKMRGHQLTQP